MASNTTVLTPRHKKLTVEPFRQLAAMLQRRRKARMYLGSDSTSSEEDMEENKGSDCLSSRSETSNYEDPHEFDEIDAHGTFVVYHKGDLVLSIKDPVSAHDFIRIRVGRHLLRTACGSRYFETLLSETRYEEGQRVASALDKLGGRAIQDVESTELPVIVIEDVGQISPAVSTRSFLMDFFSLAHGFDVPTLRNEPSAFYIANLAVIADRFDALKCLGGFMALEATLQKLDIRSDEPALLKEDRLRQRCLIGILLSRKRWVLSSSQVLIQRTHLCGSRTATGRGQWYDLPSGIEEELICRRRYLLGTIQSIQAFALAQYTSRTRQCKLGYDSSASCDSFQLGEMVRFLTRAGTLRLAGTLVLEEQEGKEDDREGLEFEGDIMGLIKRLRACPSYQIDANHRHCGLRARLLPALDLVQYAVENIGICGSCWAGPKRMAYAWTEAQEPAAWAPQAERTGGRKVSDCLDGHLAVRNMCMAKERVWWDAGKAT